MGASGNHHQADRCDRGGTNGTFRFTRTGDTSGALTVNYTVGGTATSGTDYTALVGSVTFAADSDTADVAVTAIDDTVYDPDETVVVTVASRLETSGRSGFTGHPGRGGRAPAIATNGCGPPGVTCLMSGVGQRGTTLRRELLRAHEMSTRQRGVCHPRSGAVRFLSR
ncbi:MAG TPA: Calx-beta domain-containing protein [Gemmata sp.]